MVKALTMFILAAVLALPTAAICQQVEDDVTEVVVTATRLETPDEKVASSVTVITAQEIEASGVNSVSEILNTVPGLDIFRLGGVGQQSSVLLRGADPAHLLVLVDGFAVNDPGSPKGTFNWAHMMAENIERIEVLRGPQSTLYGSDAMAGVINIITKRGKGELNAILKLEAGSFETRSGRLIIDGGDKLNYSLALSATESEGISVAEEADGNTEKDGYRNLSMSGRIDVPVGTGGELTVTARMLDSESDLDEINGNTFLFEDDPNSTIEENQLFAGTRLLLDLLGGRLEQSFGISMVDYERTYRNPPDASNPNDDLEIDDGVTLALNLQSTFDLGRGGLLTAGLDLEEDRARSQADFSGFPITVDQHEVSRTGAYLQEQISIGESVSLIAGGRLDDHDGFDDQFTYRIGTSIRMDGGWKIRGTWATGFKAPTIYQLYNSSSGNPNLNAETSKGWDVGVDKDIDSLRGTLGLTWFGNSFEDLIDFSGFTYFNVQEAKTAGMEAFAELRPAEALNVRIGYTVLDTEDVTTGEDLIRRPEEKVTVNTDYRFGERGQLNLTAIFVGDRTDRDFSTWPAATVTLDSYTLLNLAGSLAISDKLKLTGRVENLLDEQYQEVFGYGTAGISAYLGIKADM
ncbi:TonB-dependent receptor [bacterium]|nr:TonB-dependent receptor [bacterium]